MLEDATVFNLFIRPVCLPRKSNEAVTGNGTVVGWGKTEETIRSNSYSPTPFQLEVPVIEGGSCFIQFYRLAKYASNKVFCAGFVNQRKGTSDGDSGGGFYSLDRLTWTVRGIISGGLITENRQCDVNAYTLYTDVAKFFDWITEVMERPINWITVEFRCESSTT